MSRILRACNWSSIVALALDGISQSAVQPGRIELGLIQNLLGARPDREIQNWLVFLSPGEQHDGHIRGGCAQAIERFQALAAGEGQIEQDHIGGMLGQVLDGIWQPGCAPNLVFTGCSIEQGIV